MKKIICIILCFCVLLSFVSCTKEIDAYGAMNEFSAEYGLDGIIYSSRFEKYEDGYIGEELFRQIYVYDGELPRNFALFLNSRAEMGAECGIFVCRDAREREAVTEACFERMRILGHTEDGILLRTGECIFYSTLPDSERAKEVFYLIIK